MTCRRCTLFLLAVILATPGCFHRGHYRERTDPDHIENAPVFVVTETGPGFSVSEDPPGVYVTVPKKPSIRDNKLKVLMEEIIEEEGGQIRGQIGTSDLVIGIKYDSVVQEHESTYFRPQKSENIGLGILWMLGSDAAGAGYHLSKQTDWEEVKENRMKMIYKITIEVLKSLPSPGSDDRTHRPVWKAVLSVGAKHFDKYPRYFLSKLFNRYGSPDKTGEEMW